MVLPFAIGTGFLVTSNGRDGEVEKEEDEGDDEEEDAVASLLG